MGQTRFARLITMKIKRGRGRRFAKTFETEIASTAKKLKGLRRLYLLRPVGKNDEFVALSLWDDEKYAKNYVKSGQNKTYADKLAGFQKGHERVRSFLVELHTVGESAQVDD
ncbi:MAG: antibiotic biosynthesis monooxygenase [Nitrososphaerales archaeon]|nr:antibiotic biosynthesis monooxygenase [Nitrososphaerales archaeon]